MTRNVILTLSIAKGKNLVRLMRPQLALLAALIALLPAATFAQTYDPAQPLGAAEGRAGGTTPITPSTTPPLADANNAPSAPPSSAPALPPAQRIGPLLFISQTLNNCGPASVAEVLDFFGIHKTQAQVAQVLRPSLPVYGMSLYGVPFYAESVGMSSLEAVGGTDLLLKALIANGIPVIVSDLVSKSENIRHFRPIDGYDDAAGYFIGSDPYLGPNHKISYDDFDDLWKISNNRWVILYPPEKQPLVDSVLSQYWDRSAALQAGLQHAQERIATQPNMPWSWLELADMQIDAGDLTDAAANIQKGTSIGVPFEGHWLQMKLDRAQANASQALAG